MNNKNKTKSEIKTYPCRWCGRDISKSKFFECSIANGVYICRECIENKYNDLIEHHDKHKVIMVLCHYLDINFSSDIVKSLKIGQGISWYIKRLNLRQNGKANNFEYSLLNNIDFKKDTVPIKIKNQQVEELQKAIDILKNVKNEL